MGKHETDVFLYIFIGKALQANSDPLQVLDRLIMEGIYQNKTKDPEYDLLVIHTHNNLDGTKRKFILECRVAAEQTNTTTHHDHDIDININEEIGRINETSILLTTRIYDLIKRVVEVIARSSESNVATEQAMEEGLLPSF